MVAPVLRLAITATVTTFVANRALEMSHSATRTEQLGCFCGRKRNLFHPGVNFNLSHLPQTLACLLPPTQSKRLYTDKLQGTNIPSSWRLCSVIPMISSCQGQYLSGKRCTFKEPSVMTFMTDYTVSGNLFPLCKLK